MMIRFAQTIATAAAVSLAAGEVPDPRHISNGRLIPAETYADQPYIVKTDDGAWLCVMTTGRGSEGSGGQHVVSLRSTNRGRSWERPVNIEPPEAPEASYAVALKVPYGRVYAFYNHNTDNIRAVKREDGGVFTRVDSLGHYVFKYSDDHGRSWSPRRYEVQVREFECDRSNVYRGALRFFWNVGRPLVLRDAVIQPFHKVGAMGPGFFAQSEGAFLKSLNILTERDPTKIAFETLPVGEIGLRTPADGGRIAEEQSIAYLSDDSLYCVFRTVDGWPACSYSRDGGQTWTPPEYKTYWPGGRRVKHPRAANFVWNCANGLFLYWFHNHGGTAARASRDWDPYADRNPAWLMAGREIQTPQGRRLEWSQPEVVLYDDDPYIRMSYPDLVEENGEFYITETQKNLARVHKIPPFIIHSLFEQWDKRQITTDGLVLNLPASGPLPRETPMPKLPDLNQRDTARPDMAGKDLRAGFSLDLWIELASLDRGQILLGNRDAAGRGLEVTTTARGTLGIVLNDGRCVSSWDTDTDVIHAQRTHHVVIVVDGGPKIITFVVDGVLCDGGNQRQFGWGRFNPHLRTPRGFPVLRIGKGVKSLRVYNRALLTGEAVANFRAGMLP